MYFFLLHDQSTQLLFYANVKVVNQATWYQLQFFFIIKIFPYAPFLREIVNFLIEHTVRHEDEAFSFHKSVKVAATQFFRLRLHTLNRGLGRII